MIENCVNTDDDVSDKTGDACKDYLPSWCGKYDDVDFDSRQMCCTCGGGKG